MSPWTTRNIFLICLFVSGGHGFHEDTPWHNELFGDGEFYEKVTFAFYYNNSHKYVYKYLF